MKWLCRIFISIKNLFRKKTIMSDLSFIPRDTSGKIDSTQLT